MTHALLFPFSRACFRVVIAGTILVPDFDTVHCGRRCDRASVAETYGCVFIKTCMHDSDTETVTPRSRGRDLQYGCVFIKTCMHDNSDTETVTCMCGLHDGEICFTSMKVVFKGAVSRDFRPLYFFINQTHLGP